MVYEIDNVTILEHNPKPVCNRNQSWTGRCPVHLLSVQAPMQCSAPHALLWVFFFFFSLTEAGWTYFPRQGNPLCYCHRRQAVQGLQNPLWVVCHLIQPKPHRQELICDTGVWEPAAAQNCPALCWVWSWVFVPNMLKGWTNQSYHYC